MNPRTSNVEYLPGYTIPRQRRVEKYDGSWLDMIPQTPDQWIFYHQSGELRRINDMNFLWLYILYGTLRPVNYICAACTARLAESSFLYSLFLSSDRFTADHKLSVSCENILACWGNLCLFVTYFVFTCLHNAFMHVDMYTEFISFMRTPHGSRLAANRSIEKECSRLGSPQVFIDPIPGLPQRGKLPQGVRENNWVYVIIQFVDNLSAH